MSRMTTERLPHTDYYLNKRRTRYSEWQNSTSKLHYVKSRIEEWESVYNSCRKYEVKLSSIRIGHTRLTHAYLM